MIVHIVCGFPLNHDTPYQNNKLFLMLKFLADNFKPFCLTSLLAGSSVLGYLQYKASSNMKEHQDKMMNENQFKDNTRPQYEYFGINWGYRADAIVKDKLDSGDFLYMKFECGDCINVTDMARCYYNNFISPFPHYDSFGVLYRDNEGLYVIYDRFGKTYCCNYVECLCEPFWAHLSARKLKISEPQQALRIHSTVAEMYQQLRADPNKIEADKLHQEVLLRLKLVKPALQGQIDQVSIEDLDRLQPSFFEDHIRLSDAIVIRSKTNKQLDS